MIHYPHTELQNWPKRREKENFKTIIFLIPVCYVLGVGLYLKTHQKMYNFFILGLIGLSANVIFMIYAYFRGALIINNTIKEIDITETDVVFKTFSFKIWKFYTYNEKKVVVKKIDFKFHSDEFPLRDTKYELKRECHIITFNDTEFYFLTKYFEVDLSSVIG